METLQTAYGIGVRSCQIRHKLKFRLQKKTFPDRLIFLSQDYHSSTVVVSKEYLQRKTLSKTLQLRSNDVVKKAAFPLREVAVKFIEDVTDNPWLPTTGSLNEGK